MSSGARIQPMPVVDLIPAEQVWCCQFCTFRVSTRGQGVNTPMHECTAKGNLRIPMLAEGARGDVRLVERDDYVGTEDVQVDGDGRPIMRAELRHADGHSDVWAYAPTAHVGTRA